MWQKISKLLDFKAYTQLFQFSKGYRSKIGMITLFGMIISVIEVLTALATKEVVDNAVDSKIEKALLFGVLLLGLLIAEIVLNSITGYMNVKLNQIMRNEKQLELLKQIYKKQWMDISCYKSGDLLTRLYSDINNIIVVITTTIPNIISLFLQLILAFTILAYYDPLLAILAFLISPITIIASMLIGQMLRKYQYDIQEKNAQQQSLINESLQNLVILKTYNYLKKNTAAIKNIQRNKTKIIMKKNSLQIKANIALFVSGSFGMFAALAFGAYRLYKKTISFGTYTAFLQLVSQVQDPIEDIASEVPLIVTAFSSIDRITEIEKLVNEIEDDSSVRQDFESLIIEDISFSYDPDKIILNKYSLEIKRGEKVAILGSSGKGKTTLIHILLSLLVPFEGRAYFTNNSGEPLPLSVNTRNLFAYVPQTNSMFSGTIRENFLLQEEVSDEEISKVLRVTCADIFIEDLPEGIDTILLERGVGLSQGQIQRLTIARALLHNAPILIFDEATSALDYDTETQVIRNLKENYPSITLIAVTHRENILGICDRELYI